MSPSTSSSPDLFSLLPQRGQATDSGIGNGGGGKLITALSVKQPWASMITAGRKTIEVRSWSTHYRGPLLIVASKRPVEFDPVSGRKLPVGVALAIVDV
jgi:hypothetical protein